MTTENQREKPKLTSVQIRQDDLNTLLRIKGYEQSKTGERISNAEMLHQIIEGYLNASAPHWTLSTPPNVCVAVSKEQGA